MQSNIRMLNGMAMDLKLIFNLDPFLFNITTSLPSVFYLALVPLINYPCISNQIM